MAIDVQTITSEDAWAALEPRWNPLVERSASAAVFLTTEWLRPWWRHLRRPGDELCILVARDGDEVVGLAPLCRGTVPACGLGQLRRVGFIGDASGDSEYLDFAIAPGRETKVARAFFERIDADGADVLELRLLPSASPNLPAVEEAAAERGWLRDAESTPASSMELPGDWDAYLATLQARFRSKVRSLLRRLPKEHDATFDECTDAAELPERLASLFELHQQRWRAQGKPGAFASAARRRFYREMAGAFLERGWLRFHTLRLAGRAVAHEFSFEHLRRVYYLQQGYDTECGRLSVGVALKAHVLRESIARGAREYDFLGGHAPHKAKWGAQPKACVHLTLARPGLRTRWWLWAPRAAARVRDRGRALTPRALLRLKHNIQERRRKARVRRWADASSHDDTSRETPR